MVTVIKENEILDTINKMSELELCTFLEKLNTLVADRRQSHLINQCFLVDFEDREQKIDEYKEKLERIEMAWMDTKTDDVESLKALYDEVNYQMPV